jgi:hypothetical protein
MITNWRGCLQGAEGLEPSRGLRGLEPSRGLRGLE